MRRLGGLSILLLMAIAFAVALVPVFAFRDFIPVDSSGSAAEAGFSAGAAFAANKLAGGTYRSLYYPVRRRGEWVKERAHGLQAAEAFVFSISDKGAPTIWLIAFAKVATAIAVIFRGSPYEYYAVPIPTILWIAVLGSAVAGLRILTTEQRTPPTLPDDLTPEGLKGLQPELDTRKDQERIRIRKCLQWGVIVFLVGLAVAIYFMYLCPC
jgi:hypothetical protein